MRKGEVSRYNDHIRTKTHYYNESKGKVGQNESQKKKNTHLTPAFSDTPNQPTSIRTSFTI